MVKLSDIDLPMIFKDKLLFSHGFYNNLNILPEEISKSLDLTNWADQRNRSLYFSHSERDAQKWVGRVNNPHIKNGELFGDLEIHDADLAMKLGPGRAPIGVSAEIRWPQQHTSPTDFTYRGFAMVPNPEVLETMINFSKKNEDGYNSAKIQIPFTESKEEFSDKDMVSIITSGETSDFEDHKHTYGIDEMGDGSTTSGYSIGPEKQSIEHIHKIMAFQVQVSESHTHSIPKISKNSKQEDDNEDSSAEFSDGVITSETARGSPIVEEQENSNLMSAERGLNKEMENNANNVVPEVKEDIKEETVDATKETTPEKEEESKEADFSEINGKFEALSAKVLALEENFAKFSAKAEESEEVEEEEETEDAPEEIEEAKAEAVTEEEVEGEEVEAKEAKADFSEILVEKIDKLAEAITKKVAAPMSTAEFGTTGNDKGNAVIDRLTNSLSK